MPGHYSSDSNKKMIEKAMKDGKVTKKQVEKMPEKLIIGLIKKGGNGAKKKKSKK